ncbi:cysteine desulfurase [Alphaproteobacteria bacterium]|nr:cysteine desulfurase [Alphaproteobacteria bacterium]
MVLAAGYLNNPTRNRERAVMQKQDAIYLDSNATAPLRPESVAAMHKAMGPPSNPSSVHSFGRKARLAVETARENIAILANCRSQDVVFTSGGSEANNLALSGYDHIITSAIEHDSVINAAPHATVIRVNEDGVVDLAHLAEILDAIDPAEKSRILVSVMAANNETGVIQPLAEIVELARAAGVATHSDMVQLLGKDHIDFAASGLDYASLSAHKIGGPTGVGAVLVRPGKALTSMIRGGGQEQGRRSGTENFIGIAGFGAAASAAFGDVAHYADMAKWRDEFEAAMRVAKPEAMVFGAAVGRLGNTSCIAALAKPAETLVMALDIAGVAVSAGSACSSGKVKESHVLRAMNAGDGAAQAIRISGGWQTRKSDFEKLAEVMLAL